MTDSKRHLDGKGGRTACGLNFGSRPGEARSITNIPAAVTCKGCRRTLAMADREVAERRARRS